MLIINFIIIYNNKNFCLKKNDGIKMSGVRSYNLITYPFRSPVGAGWEFKPSGLPEVPNGLHPPPHFISKKMKKSFQNVCRNQKKFVTLYQRCKTMGKSRISRLVEHLMKDARKRPEGRGLIANKTY